MQSSFNRSKIQFFQPLRDDELPDITKQFLSMKHISIVSINKKSRNDQEFDKTKKMIHLCQELTFGIAIARIVCSVKDGELASYEKFC